MSLDIGIIGLEKSGRTTIFNALTGLESTSGQEHVGTTKVPEPRVDRLKEMFNSRKAVYAEIKYIDIGASLRSLSKEFSIGGKLLSSLEATDALLSVVRMFEDESVPHPQQTVDPARDIEAMDLELAFSDMAIIERRLERIGSQAKATRTHERQILEKEESLLRRLSKNLEAGIPLRRQVLAEDELKMISSFQFLSLKPLITVINIGEENLSKADRIEREVNEQFGAPDHKIVALSGKLEMEIAGLDEASRKVFLDEFNLFEPARDRVIRTSFELLGLITFLTTGEDESRAWPILKGTLAPQAAGKVHSDIERGFIRAEVISYDDLVRCESFSAARREGLLRTEGRNYIVADGDVINFLFNV